MECREELPRLQKLYEKYKDRTDVLLLTLNQDSNPAVAEAFLREHRLTLPVLPASTYVWDKMNVYGIPDNWIVDAEGVVRLKRVHYNPSQKWEEWMAELIEKYRPGAAVAPPSTVP